MEIEKETDRCASCRRELHHGADVMAAQQGVMGPRGLVPLEDPILFCSEGCLSEYYSGAEVAVVKRRIP
jgi:hypothetical protein